MKCKTLERPTKSAKTASKGRRASGFKRPPQLGKYFRMWDNVLAKWGWADKPEKDKKELRHSINTDLFGKYIRPGEFSNEQWSVMFFALELLERDGVLIWSKEMAAYAYEEGLRRIYTWWIEHAGLDIKGIAEYGAPEEYIAAIARDRFGGVRDWRALNSDKLWQLFITIKNRVRKANDAGESLWTPENAAVDAENCPF